MSGTRLLPNDHLAIEISSDGDEALAATRTMFAEHLFYFAGDEPFSIEWSKPAPKVRPPGFIEATVVAAHDVTPRMRRFTLSLADVSPFIGGNMHVRLLVPPKGRAPVWPNLQENGRIGWAEGEDELVVRVYTIRSVDAEAKHVHIDILLHPAEGIATPGADFARDTVPGQQVALMGPGGGGLPEAKNIFFAGDESALPAIARMVEEAPAGVTMKVIIEIENAGEEQQLQGKGLVEVEWLHRSSYASDGRHQLVDRVKAALETVGNDTFVWFAAEKADVARSSVIWLAASAMGSGTTSPGTGKRTSDGSRTTGFAWPQPCRDYGSSPAQRAVLRIWVSISSLARAPSLALRAAMIFRCSPIDSRMRSGSVIGIG